MTGTSTARAVAGLVSAMVGPYNTGDVLADLVHDCAELYPAAAVAVMVVDGDHGLEMLSATSHRAEELELLQIQHDRGPCLDVTESSSPIVASGEEMAQRWGSVGEAIQAAGFAGVHAYPMRWRGRALGGLNVFVDDADELGSHRPVIGQLFADLASLVVTHAADIPTEVLSARIHEAMVARSVVEQAKGVLACREGVDLARAYDVLRERARARGSSLTDTARAVIAEAQRGRGALDQR